MATKVRYEQMMPHEIVEARQAKPLAYLPIGTIEWHGRQNPLGLDTLKGHALCERAAQAGGGLVLPPLWWGEHREIELMESDSTWKDKIAEGMQLPPKNFARGYMGGKTLEDQAQFYNELLFHCYHQIVSLGFKALFVMCGHYPLSRYASCTAAFFMREKRMRIFAASEHEIVLDLADEMGIIPGDHGCCWETSLIMALRPGLTDLSRLPADAPFEELVGLGGREDPRDASAEVGERAVKALVERMVAKGDELLAAYPDVPQ